jgi:hypothetical protein
MAPGTRLGPQERCRILALFALQIAKAQRYQRNELGKYSIRGFLQGGWPDVF